MYNLCSDGINGFIALRPGITRFMRRQPLAGIADGSNKVFLCPQYPILAGPSVYLGTALQNTNAYTVDTASGTITFVTAPTVQPTADYTAIQLSQVQLQYYLYAGFLLMEGLYQRNYMLSKQTGTFAFAIPTDTNMFLVQGPVNSGGALVDPVAGSLVFSTSHVQRGFLEQCAMYAYLDSMSAESALSDVDVSERAGGVAIRTSHRSQNIMKTKEGMWFQLLASRDAALDECFPDGRHYGGMNTVIHTEFYKNVLNWQNIAGVMVPQGFSGPRW